MADSSRLVTVFRGSLSEAVLVRALLDGAGLPAFILDEQIKTIDPLITGRDIFEVELQVPEDHGLDAEGMIRDWQTRDAVVARSPRATKSGDVRVFSTRGRLRKLLTWILVGILILLSL